MSENDPRRKTAIAIAWSSDGLIGRLTIDGEFWAAVEWSERRQRWCIEDAEGRCLSHRSSIHGAEASKEAAIALAETMIRDSRMPDPETARKNLVAEEEGRKAERQKRAQQPAQIRKREERRERNGRYSDAITVAWRAKVEEDKAPPLYEALAGAFDFTDPALWKSNSFAALIPRLALHVRRAVAELEQELAYEIHQSSSQTFCGLNATKERRQAAAARRKTETSSAIRAIETKLARAREILVQLEATP